MNDPGQADPSWVGLASTLLEHRAGRVGAIVRAMSPWCSRDWRRGASVALVFLLFYVGFAPARLKNSDDVGLFRVTEALFENGTLAVPAHRHAHRGADGRLYAPYAIGQAVLALPLYALAREARHVLPERWTRALSGPERVIVRGFPRQSLDRMRGAPGYSEVDRSVYGGTLEIAFVMLYAPIASALLAMGLFLLLRRLAVSPRNALMTTVLIGVCSYPATMSVYFLRHTSETVTVVFALLWLRDYRETGRTASLALGSAAGSLTFLVRFPGVLAGPALGVYAVHAMLERGRRGARPWLPDLAAVSVPLAAAIAIHVSLNHALWGTLLRSPMTEGALESSPSFTHAFAAFLAAPGISVFAYSPLLLLLPWTLRAAAKRWPWECAVFALYAVTQLLFFSSYHYWTGLWSAPGPRYLLPGCTLLLLSLGAWLDAGPSRAGRDVLLALAGVGAVVQLALLLANWSVVAHPLMLAESQAALGSGDPTSYEPQFDFLYRPGESPILGSLHAVATGQIDAWLWKLGAGWPGEPAAPGVALALALAWGIGCAVGGRRLWRMMEQPRAPADGHT